MQIKELGSFCAVLAGVFIQSIVDLHELISKPVSSFLCPSSSSSTGLSDIPGEAMVKLYCPKCMDVYTPKSSRHHHTDGAYFGTGFPHMLFMVHPEYRPKRPANQFVPRLVRQVELEGVLPTAVLRCSNNLSALVGVGCRRE